MTDFNGAFLALANERFGGSRYEKLGLLTGLNYAAQGIGSIAIAPLVKRLPMRVILAGAVIAFAIISAMIMIVDATTGGKIKFNTVNHETLYGTWNPNRAFRSPVARICSRVRHSGYLDSPLSNLYLFWLVVRDGGAHPSCHSARYCRS